MERRSIARCRQSVLPEAKMHKLHVALLLLCVLLAFPVDIGAVRIDDAAHHHEVHAEEDEAAFSAAVEQLADRLQLHSSSSLLRQVFPPASDSTNDAYCVSCKFFVSWFLEMLEQHTELDVLIKLATSQCIAHTDMGDEVCTGYMRLYIPVAVHVATHAKSVSADKICTRIGACPKTMRELLTEHPVKLPLWRQHLLPDHLKDTSLAPATPPAPGMSGKATGETLRVLHITDLHLEPGYLAGTNDRCGKPLCCRKEDGPGPSGKLGAYQCDMVLDTIRTSLRWAATDLKPDFVIWTGDQIPHRMWDTTEEDNLAIIKTVSREVKAAFGDVPVFPILGNHEASPCNQWKIPVEEHAKLYASVAADWSPWLDNNSQQMFRHAGYYQQQIVPGLRFIGLNMNLGDVENLYTIIDGDDPGGQLAWFEAQLANSRSNDERVVIASHILQGYENCGTTYCHRIGKLMNNYKDIVAGWFAGHSHFDEFRMFLTPDGSDAAVVTYVAPSVTTWHNLNPSIRYYDWDVSSRRITDWHQYYMNMTAANESGVITWQHAYTATEAYDMPDVSPHSMYLLSQRIRKDTQLASKYATYFKAQYSKRHCDAACAHTYWCRQMSETQNDYHLCTHRSLTPGV